MKLNNKLFAIARKVTAVLPVMSETDRSDSVQWAMLTAWQYGFSRGLMIGVTVGITMTVIAGWVLL